MSVNLKCWQLLFSGFDASHTSYLTDGVADFFASFLCCLKAITWRRAVAQSRLLACSMNSMLLDKNPQGKHVRKSVELSDWLLCMRRKHHLYKQPRIYLTNLICRWPFNPGDTVLSVVWAAGSTLNPGWNIPNTLSLSCHWITATSWMLKCIDIGL